VKTLDGWTMGEDDILADCPDDEVLDALHAWLDGQTTSRMLLSLRAPLKLMREDFGAEIEGARR
jgi:hypothetical protein